MSRQLREPIVVAGGGATGCTLALLLAAVGVPSVVVERREEPLVHPAAHVINARSLEIWHQASAALAAEISALATPTEALGAIRWCCRLPDPPLGEIDVAADPELLARLRSYSPFLISHIGQHLLMPVFWRTLDRHPLIDFRRGTSAERVCATPDGVLIDIRPRRGPTEHLAARYLVAADGAHSVIRDSAGIRLRGRILAHIASVFFHAPGLFGDPGLFGAPGLLGAPGLPDVRKPLLTWIYQPRFCGALISHAADHYVLMTPYLHRAQAVVRDPAAFWDGALPEVLGSGSAFTVRSTGTWTMTSRLADRFRCGPVLLAGDAAHQFPPAGGFGLNAGVQDAQNLAWKIAAIIHGHAHDSLLDTYEPERRPVVEQFARQSVTNFFRLDEVTAPLAITNRTVCRATAAVARPPLSWLPDRLAGPACDRATRLQTRRTRALLGADARARRLRAVVSAAIPGQLEHFVFQGLEFGYLHRGPLTATEPADRLPGQGFDVVRYRPTTRPGARLPHADVRHDGGTVPSHDLICPTGLTLFTADAPPWAAAVRRHRWAAVLPVTVKELVAADPGRQGELLALFEVDQHGAVLVRPDGHVAWRTTEPASAGSLELDRFLRRQWLPYWQ